jgi:hypothetical protein
LPRGPEIGGRQARASSAFTQRALRRAARRDSAAASACSAVRARSASTCCACRPCSACGAHGWLWAWQRAVGCRPTHLRYMCAGCVQRVQPPAARTDPRPSARCWASRMRVCRAPGSQHACSAPDAGSPASWGGCGVGAGRRAARPQQAGLPDQALLHVQQVLGRQLRQAEQAAQADIAERAGLLRAQIAPGDRARAALQRVQVALGLLRARGQGRLTRLHKGGFASPRCSTTSRSPSASCARAPRGALLGCARAVAPPRRSSTSGSPARPFWA